MRKLMFLLLFVPVCCTLSMGCGKSEPTVIEPTAEEEVALAEEAAEAEEEMETEQ